MSSKSTFLNSTSRSYALALYELAKEKSELNNAEDEMSSLKTLLSENSNFREMILNPTVGKEEKKKIILKIADQYNFSETLKKFLGFLTIKNRWFFLGKIIESFLNVIAIKRGELKTKLISSKQLSKKDLEDIPKTVLEDLKIYFVKDVSEVLKLSLGIDVKKTPKYAKRTSAITVEA